MSDRSKNSLFRSALWSALIVGTIPLAACSGGGGGDDDGGSDSGLRTDACDVLGLKIINGATCQAAESPVVTYDVYYSDRTPTSCSGTMLTSTDMLTAAHCFAGSGDSVIEIRATAGSNSYTATAFGIHPEYSEQSADVPGGVLLYNDAAVIRLNSDVAVPTVPLLTSRGIVAGDIVSIFGYGLDEGGSAGTLQSGEMQIEGVLGNQFSALFSGEGSNTCQGDSGGPALLTVNGQTGIVGITSSGDPSKECMEGDLSIFANIQDSSVLNFVLSVTPGAGRI